MIQNRRKRIYSVDAKLYLYEIYDLLLRELEGILQEEIDEYNSMPEGLQDGGRGVESRDAQTHLKKAIKALDRVVDGKKKNQELMDEIHVNLRAV